MIEKWFFGVPFLEKNYTKEADTNQEKTTIEEGIAQGFNFEKRQVFDLFRDKKEGNNQRKTTNDRERVIGETG